MPEWNDLFLNKENISVIPQIEVIKFIRKLEGFFTDRPLMIWDKCCGAGRHVVFAAKSGHKAYGSDISANGINHVNDWLKRENLDAVVKVSDMTANPWENKILWNYLLGCLAS